MFDRRFILETTDDRAVLGRVVAVCHQRQCEISALSYRASDRHRAGELVLSVRAPAYAANRLPQWLLRLVDVRAVQEADASRTGVNGSGREEPAPPRRTRGYAVV